MAFQPPPSGQAHQNRKILEQLEEQKKRMRMQGQTGVPLTPNMSVPGLPTMPPPSQVPPGIPPSAPTPGVPQMILPDSQPMTPAQRTALQHANANSVGYFITQDSSFGNLILPVLPRFETK